MKRTAGMPILAAALVALAACQADKTNAPKESNGTPTAVPPAMISADMSLLIVGIDDAADRLAPALEDGVAGAELSAQLHLLSQALTQGNAARALGALTDARATLARAPATPDGGAIALALDRAEALLSDGGVDNPGPSPRSATGADIAH